ncbi:MAG: ABC transporter ATP-binding protein [Clostridiales bacterium]|nr:ABC transporter ATP-binding protein [Clostridiales bacterium]
MLLNFLFVALLGAGSVFSALIRALALPGLWMIFVKCGEPGWHALVPVWRRYCLAKCARRETEGKALLVMDIINILLAGSLIFLPEESAGSSLCATFSLILEIIIIIYEARLYNGVCELFGKKKSWTLLWILFMCIPALRWGFSKKYMPLKQEEAEMQGSLGAFAEGRTAGSGSPLSVSIEKRVAGGLINRKVLLRDIRMQIEPGSMVLLLGGSGAGKTTLLNAVTGYEKADAEVLLGGGNVYKDYRKMMYDIGFVPQGDLMRGTDTVRNTLSDAAALRMAKNCTKAERRARVDEVMKVFGLLPVQSSLVEKLSGGQRKRLSIAMEFLSDPSLFILDEPDSGLDGVMARELMQQLRAIADQGKIVIVITHTPDRVIDLFDDVIVLAKDSQRTGRLAYYGPVGEAKEFFGRDTMEKIVRSINRTEEGGEGRADEFIERFAEVRYV